MLAARILIGCEVTGIVRDAFLARGFDAWSCDLRHSKTPGPHIVGDVRRVLSWGWHAAIFFPECRYLCSSGLFHNGQTPGRADKTEAALDFVRELLDCPVPMVALENPVGAIGTRIRKADQSIQPYQFGEDASKRTCLWLRGLPRLRATRRQPGRIVDGGVERWSNQTDKGFNKLPPTPDRSDLRAATYPGIARAMAKQWGDCIAARVGVMVPPVIDEPAVVEPDLAQLPLFA